MTTAGEPARVRLTKEEHVITADGKDLSYIHYEIVDEDGNVVPTANNLVHSIFMGKGKSLVWTMGNKLAVNVIRLRKMVHGKEKPSMVKVLSSLNRLKKKVNSLYMRILQAWLQIRQQSQPFQARKKIAILSLLLCEGKN